MNKSARDFGDRQVKDEYFQKILSESYVEYALCKLPMMRRVYEGMNDAALLQKVKTKMDDMVDLWIEAKININYFINKFKDRDAYHAQWQQNNRPATAQRKVQNMWQSTPITPNLRLSRCRMRDETITL